MIRNMMTFDANAPPVQAILTECGQKITDRNEMNLYTCAYLQKLLGKGLPPKLAKDHTKIINEGLFNLDDVHRAIADTDGNKSHGLDWFSVKMLKTPALFNKVSDAVLQMMNTGIMPDWIKECGIVMLSKTK